MPVSTYKQALTYSAGRGRWPTVPFFPRIFAQGGGSLLRPPNIYLRTRQCFLIIRHYWLGLFFFSSLEMKHSYSAHKSLGRHPVPRIHARQSGPSQIHTRSLVLPQKTRATNLLRGYKVHRRHRHISWPRTACQRFSGPLPSTGTTRTMPMMCDKSTTMHPKAYNMNRPPSLPVV